MCVEIICHICNRKIEWLCIYDNFKSVLTMECDKCSPNKKFKIINSTGINPNIPNTAEFCELDGYIDNPYIIFNPTITDKLRQSFNPKASIMLQHDVRINRYETISTPAIINIAEVENFLNIAPKI